MILTMAVVSSSAIPSNGGRISASTVLNALRVLMDIRVDRTGRAALLGYLTLKARETAPGAEIDVRAIGPGSLQPELNRFFGLAPDSPQCYVNPFGTREGRLEWLGQGYERRGPYSWLYEGRTLARFLNVRKEGDHFFVAIPNSAPAYIAAKLGRKIPFEPAAAFLLRGEVFPNIVGHSDTQYLSERFQTVFHLRSIDIEEIFDRVPTFAASLDSVGFRDAIDSLPPYLHPPRPAQAEAATAIAGLVDLEPSDAGDIVVSDTVGAAHAAPWYEKRPSRLLALPAQVSLGWPTSLSRRLATVQIPSGCPSLPSSTGLPPRLIGLHGQLSVVTFPRRMAIWSFEKDSCLQRSEGTAGL